MYEIFARYSADDGRVKNWLRLESSEPHVQLAIAQTKNAIARGSLCRGEVKSEIHAMRAIRL
jgi:hypothetical protein